MSEEEEGGAVIIIESEAQKQKLINILGDKSKNYKIVVKENK